MAQAEEASARDIASRLSDSVRGFFLARGFKVEAPAKLRGESGAEHTATLSAISDNSPRVILDTYASGEKIGEEEVINTYTKVLDTSPSKAFIICLPGATELARRLAILYKIGLVEGSSVEEVVGNLSIVAVETGNPAQTTLRATSLDLSKPGVLKCRRCGYVWKTKSEARYVKCPSCFDKVTRSRSPAPKVVLQRS